ncbi:hemerythrin domain-containing protein [Pseudomarimonas arenosa]|uniref:Hemerythrin domain-containing protein n=1 Tax=Pseudomarimonas arenosa TaxID=2774145 RepID=A0AAW3ZNB7_9GAMM|nr:hemerythrin domain-containing protein [Pseudomarimonas arenosa]MBD8526674.1 hemerythrin domain-containing protein [Pseudomarimonas arenosa]
MLELLRKIIGQPPAPPVERPVVRLSTTPSRTPSFDSRLIDVLKQDHADLVDLFQQIGLCAEQRRYAEVAPMLLAFKTRLESHLIAENVRFYNYVERSLDGDEENYALMRSFRREMNGIARGVVDFVKAYQQHPLDDDSRQAFLRDYRQIGGLLTQRIEREESSLYPLYQPI